MLLLLVGLRVYKYHLFVEEGNYIFSRSTQEFIILLITIGLISAAGYLVNDILDVIVDEVNVPQKKLAFSNKILWSIYFVMNGLAVVLSLLISETLLTLFILITSIILLFLYSKVFQKLPLIGNLVVASLAGVLPVLYEDFDLIFIKKNGIINFSYQFTIYFYVFFGFVVSLFREVIKDIEDIEGDRKGGYKTLAVLLGENLIKPYLLFFMFLVLLVFLILIIPNLILSFSFSHLMMVLGVCFYIVSMIYAYKIDFSKSSLFLKLTLFSGVLILFIL